MSDFGGIPDQPTLALYLDGVRKAGLNECATRAELQKYPKITAMTVAHRKWEWASCMAAASRISPRSFQAVPAANTAKIPKKTPVNSSQRTPESFTTGPSTASPKFLLPRLRPSPVCNS